MNKDVRPPGRGRAAIIAPAVPPSQWRFAGPFSHNVQLYEAATILAQLVRRDPTLRPWQLSTAYIEFENNGGAAVTVPTPAKDVDEGLTYYNNLSLSATRDYLRVPVVHTQLTSEDDALYPGGNLVTFYAQTAGTTGVHGKAFTDGVSRVYGMALVAAPEGDDASGDLVYARLYYSAANQQYIKPANVQISVEYQLPFE